jgi:pimeloyl-ACP methyl ester carboxylesterase
MLPAKGPWEHPYYRIEDAYSHVSFTDTDGRTHRIGVRQKVTGEGPPIVLVHGLMSSSYSWRYVLEPLGRRYTVHAPDLVGSGLTDKPLDLRYSVANLGRFVAAYARAVSKEPVYLVGNSLGGLYCLAALSEASAGAAAIARRFLLMHAPGYPLVRTRLSHLALRVPGMRALLGGIVAHASHRFPHAFVANTVHYARKDMLSEEECVETGRLFETLEGGRVFAKILAESLDPAEHAALIGALRDRGRRTGHALPCPVKILYATKDRMVPPSFGPRYHADLPGSELVWMDDASHFLHVDAPERTVAEILAFDRGPCARAASTVA